MPEHVELVCAEMPISVVVLDPGPRAVEVTKVLHRLTGLSLWHSKTLISDVPATVLEDLPEDAAATAATALRAAGALVEVRRQPMSPAHS
ncbi:ribosomal protein L7/L12 [Streptomyces lydicus]|uniref:ribosomal protein L7/L12 n=1 Tax=Streptomyces lydicus TaxID=47763 RepID=UPI000981FC20|nr:ribosomal protein L7/L12 [Streptomyces lydicus]